MVMPVSQAYGNLCFKTSRSKILRNYHLSIARSFCKFTKSAKLHKLANRCLFYKTVFFPSKPQRLCDVNFVLIETFG